jgi:purine-binding chemotaxis protein CheW
MSENMQNQSWSAERSDFVTITVDGQLFGIPVLTVQDILGVQRLTPVPLAPKEIAGSLNLRGRIVTAIDMRTRLGLPPSSDENPGMSVVIEHKGELYSLIVDSVGEVLRLSTEDYERNPATLDSVWRDVSTGVFRLDGGLMVVLDVVRVLEFSKAEAA